MTAELNILIADPKWQKVFSAIIRQYERLQRLTHEMDKLEAIIVDERGEYCYCWNFYRLIFSEYVRKRHWYSPWTTEMIPRNILQYELAKEQETKSNGQLTLESNLGKPWTVNVTWVCWEWLSSIPGIERWLREVCVRHEETIRKRKEELQIFGEYVDDLADVVTCNDTRPEDV